MELFENAAPPWWHRGVRFECLRCGRCCRGDPGAVWFTPEEEMAMAKHLDLETALFRRNYTVVVQGRPSIKERRNGECIFLNPVKQSCSIYPVRPVQCGLFPFWPSVFVSQKRWNLYAQACPGMNRGRAYHPQEIAERLDTSPFRDL